MGYSLIFDPGVGASGDMILSSLIAIGSDEKRIRGSFEKALKLKITFKDASKETIMGKQLEVMGEEGEYSLEDMERMLDYFIRLFKFSGKAESFIMGAFNSLVDAEKKAHGTDTAEFHEIGRGDTIIDIVGTAMALESLDAFENEVFSLPIAVGRNVAPATLEILNSNRIGFFERGIRHELCTPTGAAILSNVAKPIERLPKMVVKSVGYGCGKADLEIPNVIGAIIADVVVEK